MVMVMVRPRLLRRFAFGFFGFFGFRPFRRAPGGANRGGGGGANRGRGRPDEERAKKRDVPIGASPEGEVPCSVLLGGASDDDVQRGLVRAPRLLSRRARARRRFVVGSSSVQRCRPLLGTARGGRRSEERGDVVRVVVFATRLVAVAPQRRLERLQAVDLRRLRRPPRDARDGEERGGSRGDVYAPPAGPLRRRLRDGADGGEDGERRGVRRAVEEPRVEDARHRRAPHAIARVGVLGVVARCAVRLARPRDEE